MNPKLEGRWLLSPAQRLIWVNLRPAETTLLVKQVTECRLVCVCACERERIDVWVWTLTVDDGGGQDGSHGGLLRQELDAVQQPGWVHALAQRHVVHRLQTRVKVHRKRHQLLALHHVFGGGAPQLATWTKQMEETFKSLPGERRKKKSFVACAHKEAWT